MNDGHSELRSMVGRLLVGCVESSLVVGWTLARRCVEFCSAWKLVEEEAGSWNLSALYTLQENRIESDST